MPVTMLQKIWLIFLTATFGLTVLSPTHIAIAQPKKETLPNNQEKPKRTVQSASRLRLNLPPSLGKPNRRVPAATRGGSCIANNPKLTALIPKYDTALTTVGNPTLYFFIPQNTAAYLELVIQNENDNEQTVYQQKYQTNTKAGIVGINLPPNVLALEQKYTWNFAIICNPENPALSKVVKGTIQRFENPSLMKKLAQATLQERVQLYAEAGIWHDALDTLARLRASRPNDFKVKADWEALLTAPGVEFDKQLAQKPLSFAKETPKLLLNN
ncbi:hypothetical protein BCD64_21335 [Nostoc sp. MBR 210]|uniref:DUF928 domain-containing protein n=1 Tax=Nostoc spongiaeforme FACHB-130 TaxID=1357510 RepID=A0ABR8FTZ8_9NOSO|nr:DUF928 domain-containing protein [Nostoc spongiaeforme]MBD2594624.1 DUF928 domain-containing protein [Nostoc spongiaeforme FACHB-130]OCQ97391.1 hypothetical protein BCD64_21335 [Nostoc sp. MBR 210]